MTSRVRSAFGLLVALVAFAGLAVAQQTTGKVEGTVTDQANVPLANAQVLIVGTSFGAVTNDKGYYFINNVPVGTYAVRAQFIGYAPAEVRGVRVLGGQTITVDVAMQTSAVEVTGVTVTAATNPIVPRDQVTSKSIITNVDELPANSLRAVLALQPGVIETGAGGLVIRGGRPGEANIYVDGAPVRNTNSGNAMTEIGTNAIEEASVTTGALGVEFADAQSGVISVTTRAGGTSYAGSFEYQTDEMFGDALSVGANRFEGSFGGPVPGVRNLTFFLSGVLQGTATDQRGAGYEDAPFFVSGGVDTVVTLSNGSSVTIPQFVQYTGSCGNFGSSATPAAQAMRNNYGFECQGRRFAMDWTTVANFSGKLQYTYGDGSRVSLSGVANGTQGRNPPTTNILVPQTYSGFHNWQRWLILDANHTVSRSAERALSLNLNLSWQRDYSIAGPLDPAYEADSRSPFLGLELGAIEFWGGAFNMPFPITEDVIRNIRTNSGTRVPLLNREDLRNSQPYRINPFGLKRGAWYTSGFDVGGTLNQETRLTGRLYADWQANRYNRVQLGGDVVKTDLAFWSSGFLRQAFMDAYVVDPLKYGLYASDRLDLGDVVLELGVRYDYYKSNALYANVPLRIYTNPAWSPQAATNPDSLAASLGRVMTEGEGHSALSPRLRVSFPITEQTGFRLSYSHQVQSPDFSTMMTGINNDLDFTNTNDVVGRDLQFGKTILFEFGVRHAFSQDLVLDLSAYNKDKVSDYAARILPYNDPFNPGDTLNVNVLTNGDFGNVRGFDAKLDARIGGIFSGALTYTFQDSRSTGSDPFSYLRTTARQISQVTGDRVPPPQAILPTDDNRSHNFAGTLSLSLPDDFRQGTWVGAVFRNVVANATFRAQSGFPYTRLKNDGNGVRAPRSGFGLEANAIEAINSSTMPWTKLVDLRLNKGFTVGRLDVLVYAQVNNLFNWKNINQIFAETGDIVNALHRNNVLATESSELLLEAESNGALNADNSIDLTGNCGAWLSPVNCVMLQRTEARFGNGDRTYTAAEQSRALNTFYDAFSGVQTFYGTPRYIRLGVQLNF
jgi:hypothetical protein